MVDKIETFSRFHAQVLRSRIDAAMKQIAADAGIIYLGLGNGRYTDDSLRFMKVEFAAAENASSQKLKDLQNDPATAKREAARQAFVNYAASYMMDKSWLDKTVILQGTEFKIIGLNTRASKAPVNILRVRDGAPFKTSVREVRFAMGTK